MNNRVTLGVVALLLGLAVTTPVRPAHGQSAYVPLDDVAYVYIDALMARSELRSLSALDRPYTTRAIADALATDAQRRAAPSRPTARSSVDTTVRSALRRAVSKYEYTEPSTAPLRGEASAGLWVTGETSGQRELMRADRHDPAAYAGGAFRVLMTGGPVVAYARPTLENRLNSDPDFPGRKDRWIAGRMEDSYVAAQWEYGELFFGRMGRNWGPAPLQGLLLSNAPYSYDHAFGRFGVDRINISLLLARLENDNLGTGDEVQRYFATHRLSTRWRGFEAAIAESYVYSGVGRGFEPSFANPFSVYALTWRNERQPGNLLMSGQLSARTPYGLFAGEVLLDDIQIDRCDTSCSEPASYGFTLTAEGVSPPFGPLLFGSYTRVSSLAYRTPTLAERYANFDVSLGRAFSDYDEWRIGADLIVFGASLRPYFAQRRQGEGDYRLAFPAPENYATHPAIFEGSLTRIRRLAVSGGAVRGEFDVKGDIGFNWVSSALPFATPSSFEGRVRVSWNPRWALATRPIPPVKEPPSPEVKPPEVPPGPVLRPPTGAPPPVVEPTPLAPVPVVVTPAPATPPPVIVIPAPVLPPPPVAPAPVVVTPPPAAPPPAPVVVTPEPVTPEPVAPAPVAPAPVTPTPVAPAPVLTSLYSVLNQQGLHAARLRARRNLRPEDVRLVNVETLLDETTTPAFERAVSRRVRGGQTAQNAARSHPVVSAVLADSGIAIERVIAIAVTEGVVNVIVYHRPAPGAVVEPPVAEPTPVAPAPVVVTPPPVTPQPAPVVVTPPPVAPAPVVIAPPPVVVPPPVAVEQPPIVVPPPVAPAPVVDAPTPEVVVPPPEVVTPEPVTPEPVAPTPVAPAPALTSLYSVLNQQGLHAARLRARRNLRPEDVRLVNVETLVDESSSAALERAVSRRVRGGQTAQNAARSHPVVSAVLADSGIAIERVIAIAVTEGVVNVIVYHRPAPGAVVEPPVAEPVPGAPAPVVVTPPPVTPPPAPVVVTPPPGVPAPVVIAPPPMVVPPPAVADQPPIVVPPPVTPAPAEPTSVAPTPVVVTPPPEVVVPPPVVTTPEPVTPTPVAPAPALTSLYSVLNQQGLHAARLRARRNLRPEDVRLVNVETLLDETTTPVFERAVSRRVRGGQTAQNAARSHPVVSAVLADSGIAIERVIAIAVTEGVVNVIVYHRPAPGAVVEPPVAEPPLVEPAPVAPAPVVVEPPPVVPAPVVIAPPPVVVPPPVAVEPPPIVVPAPVAPAPVVDAPTPEVVPPPEAVTPEPAAPEPVALPPAAPAPALTSLYSVLNQQGLHAARLRARRNLRPEDVRLVNVETLLDETTTPAFERAVSRRVRGGQTAQNAARSHPVVSAVLADSGIAIERVIAIAVTEGVVTVIVYHRPAPGAVPEPPLVEPAPVAPAPVVVEPRPVAPPPVTPPPVTPPPVTPQPAPVVVTPEPVAPEPVAPAPVTPPPAAWAPLTELYSVLNQQGLQAARLRARRNIRAEDVLLVDVATLLDETTTPVFERAVSRRVRGGQTAQNAARSDPVVSAVLADSGIAIERVIAIAVNDQGAIIYFR